MPTMCLRPVPSPGHVHWIRSDGNCAVVLSRCLPLTCRRYEMTIITRRNPDQPDPGTAGFGSASQLGASSKIITTCQH